MFATSIIASTPVNQLRCNFCRVYPTHWWTLEILYRIARTTSKDTVLFNQYHYVYVLYQGTIE